MRRVLVVLVMLAAAGCSDGGATRATAPHALRTVDDVPLPGSTGRFDYESLDPSRHLLVIAHLGDSSLIGFDTTARRVIWQAGNISSVHGVRVAPELGRVFASATGRDEVVALDEATGRVVGRAPTGRFPDGLAYDPVAQTVYVSDKDVGAETVVDARTLRVLDTVAVGEDVGNVQYDDVTRTMLVAVGHSSELVVLDPATRRVERRVALPGCQGAHGVAIDTSAGRAFVACENNAKVADVEIATGRVTATQRTGRSPDVLALDSSLNRLYVAAEDGFVGAYGTDNASLPFRGLSRVANGAHTVAVDPATHLAYLALADVAGRPVLRVMAPTGAV